MNSFHSVSGSQVSKSRPGAPQLGAGAQRQRSGLTHRAVALYDGVLDLESPLPSAFEFAAQVAQAYSALIVNADREAGLGGRLFYVGDLDDIGRACVVAANIAGAATLVATSDRAAQKQAIRDGVTDFLVNSLDEALRILKNQLRKRETVSVCVSLSPTTVEGEMKERGVEPDLLRHDVRFAPRPEALMLRDEPRKPRAICKEFRLSSPGAWIRNYLGTWPDSMKSPSTASARTNGRHGAGCVLHRAISAALRRVSV